MSRVYIDAKGISVLQHIRIVKEFLIAVFNCIFKKLLDDIIYTIDIVIYIIDIYIQFENGRS